MSICKGCNGHEDCWLSNNNNCPCENCIIKTMCSEACESFTKFEDECFKMHEIEYTREYVYEPNK